MAATQPSEGKRSLSDLYTELVDHVTLNYVTSRSKTDVFDRIRLGLRAIGFTTAVKNPLAHIDSYDLWDIVGPKRLDVARELRRRLLQGMRPADLENWNKLAKLIPPTEAEIRKAAQKGLPIPYLSRLHYTKPIPRWLHKPYTLTAIYRLRPQWTRRIDELLMAGAVDTQTLHSMINDVLRTDNIDRLKELVGYWPQGQALRDTLPPRSLAAAEVLAATHPEAVPSRTWVQVYYRAGMRDRAAQLVEQLLSEHSDGWRRDVYELASEGIDNNDLDWINLCAPTNEYRCLILADLLDNQRKPQARQIAEALLQTDKWRGAFQEECSYLVRRIIDTKSSALIDMVISEVPENRKLNDDFRACDTDLLVRFLRRRPTDHDEYFWRHRPANQLRMLVPLAHRFSAEEARVLLDKLDERDCVHHVLRETECLFSLSQLVQMPPQAAEAILTADRIDRKKALDYWALDRTKLSVRLLKQLIGPRTPYVGLVDPVGMPDVNYRGYPRACCLIWLIGYKGATPEELIKLTKSTWHETPKEVIRLLPKFFPRFSDAQVADLFSCSQAHKVAAKEAERRAQAGPISKALCNALLHSDHYGIFLRHIPDAFVPTRKDMLRLIALEQWDLALKYRSSWKRATDEDEYASPDDELFAGVTKAQWDRMLDLGFRASPLHSDEDLHLKHIERGLWSEAQINQSLCRIIHHYGREGMLPTLVPAPAGVQGHVIDFYNQGLLDTAIFKPIVTEGQTLQENKAALQNKLREMQAAAPESRRACIVQFAKPENRWELLTGSPAPERSLSELNPFGFSPKGFRAILGAALHEAYRSKTEPRQVIRPAFNLTVAFGNLTEVRKMLQKRNSPSKAPLHDLGQFSVPNRGTWNIGAWRQLLEHHSGRGLKLLHLAPRIEAKLGRVPTTMEEAERLATVCAYRRAEENQPLAKLCLQYHRDEEQFEAYLDLLKRAKKEDCCPDIHLSPEQTGTDCYFDRIQIGDPVGPMLGLVTNCCQHLDGFASDCAGEGVVNPTASFYKVTRKGRIVAQCFAWRTKTSLVFDSWESLSDDYDFLCEPLIRVAATEALRLDPNLVDVRIGSGGGTPELPFSRAKACSFEKELDGMDSSSQLLIASRNPKHRNKQLPNLMAA